MAYAIIQTCGKQYKVSVGDIVDFEKLEDETGSTVTFPFVVLSSDGADSTEVGAPFLAGKSVEGEILDHAKADKIRVVHKKSKKRMLKVRGHKQPYTRVRITKIS